jgi:hypothetical protein
MKIIEFNCRFIISQLVVTIVMNEERDVRKAIWRAAQYVRNTDEILVAAGARMGVDAGLSDYHAGIHLAHPRLAAIGLSLYDFSNHGLFEHNPALAWGHWVTRQREYMNGLPHEGYHILHTWSQCSKRDMRVITSNLDRHWDASHVEVERMRHETFFRKLSPERVLTVLEIGCGTAMDKVRTETTRIVTKHRIRGGRAAHIRINLHQAHINEHKDNISLPLGALEALRALNQLMSLS